MKANKRRRNRRQQKRHQLTPEDRRKAWRTTLERHPHLGLWLLQRCRQTSPAPYDRCTGKYY